MGEVYTFGESDGGKLGIEGSSIDVPTKVELPEKVMESCAPDLSGWNLVVHLICHAGIFFSLYEKLYHPVSSTVHASLIIVDVR